MSNLRKFKDSSVPKFKGVSISHDLHPNERLEIKNMVETAKKKLVEAVRKTTGFGW